MGFPRYSLWGDNRVRGGKQGKGCAVATVEKPQVETKTLGTWREPSCPSPAQTGPGAQDFQLPAVPHKLYPRDRGHREMAGQKS